MQTSLDRHLKNVGRPYSILCDRQFQLFSKNSSDCQIWQSSEISSPNYFQIVQHVVLLHIQIPPYYGIGQIYGNWIFQPFFFTIFPKYIHIVEEVNIFSGGAVWLWSYQQKCELTFSFFFPHVIDQKLVYPDMTSNTAAMTSVAHVVTALLAVSRIAQKGKCVASVLGEVVGTF